MTSFMVERVENQLSDAHTEIKDLRNMVQLLTNSMTNLHTEMREMKVILRQTNPTTNNNSNKNNNNNQTRPPPPPPINENTRPPKTNQGPANNADATKNGAEVPFQTVEKKKKVEPLYRP